MTHHMAARMSVWLMGFGQRMRDQRGQGTVEYVGVVVTMALLLGAVALAAKGWGGDVSDDLKKVVKNAIGYAGKGFVGK